MIKAEELRIGNWVIYASMWQQVYSIGETSINIAQEPLKINMIKPIQLTEEILLKCRFEYMEETGSYADDKHLIQQSSDRWLFMPYCTNDDDCYIQIQFLHQLQNIYYFNSVFTELQFKP